MKKGIMVVLTGEQATETSRVLAVRLIEHNCVVELFDQDRIRTHHGNRKALEAMEQFVHNGVVVLAPDFFESPEEREMVPTLEVEIAAYDTPDFAAEKILDELAEAGVLMLADTVYSPEDEERIRKRLADLGYIE